MDIKVILLTIISCINAEHLNRDLLPPDLPPAKVANIFHESGITFVSPSSRNVEISSSVLAPPLPITHAFGFISHSSNKPQELVRTHSSQRVNQRLHTSVLALDSPNGIKANINGRITSHPPAVDDNGHQDIHITVQSPPRTDVVQARFVENDFHGVHEVNSRTQHFEYKVPLPRTVPQHIIKHAPHQQRDSKATNHFASQQRNSVLTHSTYGVPANLPSKIPEQLPSNTPALVSSDTPTFIPSQDEIEALPIFHNDKFLSPVVRHTKTPTAPHSNLELPAPFIASIFDVPPVHSNSPTIRTRANIPAHSINIPTTRTTENIIGGNNQYSNRFSLSDGTKVSERGRLISPRAGWENVIAKQGEYEYTSPEGVPVKVKWIADHEGFRVLN